MPSPLQVLLASIIETLSHVLPFSRSVGNYVLEHLNVLDEPSISIHTLSLFGVILALIVYFRHDILSQTVAILRLIVERKRPTSIDERLPWLYLISWIPFLISFAVSKQDWCRAWIENGLVWSGIPYLLSGLLLLWGEKRAVPQKGYAAWNAGESILIGCFSALAILPGLDRLTATAWIGRARGFRMDALFKFLLLSSIPLLILQLMIEGERLSDAYHYIGLIPAAISLGGSFAITLFISSFLCGPKPPTRIVHWAYFKILFGILACWVGYQTYSSGL